MAGDRDRFEKARTKWQKLKDEGSYSYPSGAGLVAILCSYHPYYELNFPKEHAIRDRRNIKIFRKEAYKIARLLQRSGKTAEIIQGAVRTDYDDVIAEPSVSDIILIGHGTLSKTLPSDGKDTPYTWEDAANATTHLKTGRFIQRMCGGLHDMLPVPLGMFVVSDFTDVIAAPGSTFMPASLRHPDNKLLVPVFGSVIPTYDGIKAISRHASEVPLPS